MRRCLQPLVAELRSVALKIAHLILRQFVLLAGRSRLVCVRRRPITQGHALGGKDLLLLMQLASRSLQMLVRCGGHAVSRGEARQRAWWVSNVRQILRQRVLTVGLRAGQCASRLRTTRAHVPLQADSGNTARKRNMLLRMLAAVLGLARRSRAARYGARVALQF